METQTCTFGETLDELIKKPIAFLGLIGADADDDEDEDETSEDDESEDEDEDDEDEESEDDESGDANKKSKKKADPKDGQIEHLKQENITQRRKYKAVRDENATLRSQITELEKKGLTDEEVKAKYTTLEKTNETLTSTNQNLALRVAFLSDNTYSWLDPKAALKLVDLEEVEIDDKGKVDGLQAALDTLAQEMPWLLKAPEEKKPAKKKEPATRTGDKPAGVRTNLSAAQKAREATLKDKYAGLRR